MRVPRRPGTRFERHDASTDARGIGDRKKWVDPNRSGEIRFGALDGSHRPGMLNFHVSLLAKIVLTLTESTPRNLMESLPTKPEFSAFE
jgi:hypothetical protein